MEREEESRSKDKPVFTPYSFDELLKMPPKEWLLDQVFGAGDIGMFYGTPGCGKTFLIIDMIMSLCTGSRWATGLIFNDPFTSLIVQVKVSAGKNQ